MQANRNMVEASPWGQFTFGPAIDGSYVRDLPGRELLNGNYVKDLSVLVGHTKHYNLSNFAYFRNEGIIFVDPMLYAASETEAREKLKETLPLAKMPTLRKVNRLYPSPERSFGFFQNQFDRIDELISGPQSFSQLTKEWIFNCNVRYITQAYGNDTYNYVYSLIPSIHSSDVIFTFTDFVFDHDGQRHNFNINYLKAWQSYLISFIKHGDPNIERDLESTIPWGLAGEQMWAINMRMRGFEWIIDEQVDEERCAFWQRAEYAPPWDVAAAYGLKATAR